MDTGDRQTGGPSADGADIRILAVPQHGKLLVRFLGPILGIHTHWARNRAFACIGEDECPTPIHKERVIWKGYAAAEWIAAANQKGWTPCVLEVTENLYHQIGPENHRGETWRLFRHSRTKNKAEVRGTLVRRQDCRGLRTDVDVQKAVRRLYRELRIAFGLDPLFGGPQRLLEFPVEADDLPPVPQQERVQTPEEVAEIRRKLKQAREMFNEPAGNGQAKKGS